jgi:hypothetical protein
MFTSRSRALMRLAGPTAALALLAVSAAPASALSSGQVVSGTTATSLSLTAGGAAVLAPFAPGNTATGSSILTATDTSPTWTLQVADASNSATPGDMVATSGTCTNSEANLANPLKVTVADPLNQATSAGQKSISGTATTVMTNSATTPLPLAADALTTSYSQLINSNEALAAGCIYQLTATFTLQ